MASADCQGDVNPGCYEIIKSRDEIFLPITNCCVHSSTSQFCHLGHSFEIERVSSWTKLEKILPQAFEPQNLLSS